MPHRPPPSHPTLPQLPAPLPAAAPTPLLRRLRRLAPIAVVAAALACASAQAETPAADGPPTSGAAQLAGDIKAYVTAPLHAGRAQWVRFGAVLGAVAFAYQHDEQMRAQFGSTSVAPPGTTPDTYDSEDALASVLVVGGTWVAALVLNDDDGRQEAGSMVEAAALGSAAAYLLKEATGRERPYVAGDPSAWQSDGDSFPSMHVTAAFAIGTVFAESGGDRFRLLRRVLGYGIAAGTAYHRMDHDAHWLSDTVAGAGLGVATARFVMKRRETSSRRAELGLAPLGDGFALTYTVPFRP